MNQSTARTNTIEAQSTATPNAQNVITHSNTFSMVGG